jgi:hypothetical protein
MWLVHRGATKSDGQSWYPYTGGYHHHKQKNVDTIKHIDTTVMDDSTEVVVTAPTGVHRERAGG